MVGMCAVAFVDWRGLFLGYCYCECCEVFAGYLVLDYVA